MHARVRGWLAPTARGDRISNSNPASSFYVRFSPIALRRTAPPVQHRGRVFQKSLLLPNYCSHTLPIFYVPLFSYSRVIRADKDLISYIVEQSVWQRLSYQNMNKTRNIPFGERKRENLKQYRLPRKLYAKDRDYS